MLLAETNEGYHNLIKLVSAGYTEGFYYKPRIDKELLAQHAKGLIGLSSCLKGEVAEGLSHQQERKAIEAAAAYRDILGPDNFFLEMQWHGIEDQRVVNSGLPAIARDLRLPLVCTNDVHYLRETDAHPHDILLCIGTGKAFSDPEAAAVRSHAVLPEDGRRRWRRSSRTFPRRWPNTVRIAERCDVRLAEGENFLPNFDVPAPFTLDEYFEHVVREGFEQRLPRLQAAGVDGRAAPHDRRVRAAALVRDRDDQADEVPGLLPDRLGLHPLRARAGHSGRARARVGGRQPGGLLPADHRRRSARASI